MHLCLCRCVSIFPRNRLEFHKRNIILHRLHTLDQSTSVMRRMNRDSWSFLIRAHLISGYRRSIAIVNRVVCISLHFSVCFCPRLVSDIVFNYMHSLSASCDMFFFFGFQDGTIDMILPIPMTTGEAVNHSKSHMALEKCLVSHQMIPLE